MTSQGHNLVGEPTGCDITLLPSDLTGDPGLEAFIDDGTPGNGHFPLLPTSPAIDAANDAACPPIDQLGQSRIGRCDIGAIEFHADCADLAMIEASFGTHRGQPGFDPRADTNNDGVVNVKDLAFVAQHLPAGTHCP